ncbi:MAG: hypothetical protein IJ802_03195 [Kiritimatiellae bacterium]|nr:hypothetical protein [Kiritimatiellia bacterium]
MTEGDEMHNTHTANCTIVVCSCDKYADLHGAFAHFMHLNWPDRPFPIVLVTESVCGGGEWDAVIRTGGGKPWCTMLAEALETISTPAVMLMMDDYLISRKVETAQILRRLEQFERLGLLNLRLSPNPKPSGGAVDGLCEYKKNTAYCVSCQTGFWDREWLRSLASKFASAWEFERMGSFSFTADETRPIVCTEGVEFHYVDSVHKGYWEKAGVRLCAANGYEIDFTRRTLPPLKVRFAELVKKIIFHIVPVNLLVRFQNRFGGGAK